VVEAAIVKEFEGEGLSYGVGRVLEGVVGG